MAYVVLDIGAGAPTFAQDLRSRNPATKMLVFCGEPQWGIGPFFRAISSERIERLLVEKKAGVHRITATYAKFNLPDESLDLVTLNSPHPFFFGSVAPIVHELRRCLKPGGLFFSSFSLMDLARVPEEFEEIGKGRWDYDTPCIDVSLGKSSRVSSVRFPQSPTLSSNIREHRFGDPRAHGSEYLYADGISPAWVAWEKPA